MLLLAMTVQANTGNELTPFGEVVDADPRGRVELAHAIGVDPTTLWRWMTGRSRPQSIAMQRQAALALGRPLDVLWPDVHVTDAAGEADGSDTHDRKAA